ncbi:3-keto-5-aminohexanoate cleavage protein [Vibrio sp. CyArs1]|uniref:3-keto-5-aminohexanoate cleavage protein n=1 Tax=Vibrio sp. CyArs1 TaxID=2682577 RepID=UPI001F064026|nr:3-keto-5-aminohexanoate cleavage protein [Vibrio sp. CyArs1]
MSNLTMPSQSAIIVAPNGARKTQKDHPALPITRGEIIQDVIACRSAGAAMVHLHARNEKGLHSLDVADNLPLYNELKDAVGDSIMVQLTTEAVGQYQPEQQRQLIKAVKPEAASFALSELIPNDEHLSESAEFFHWVAQQGIIAQYILYSADDLDRYFRLIDQKVLPDHDHHLLLVLGRYKQGQVATPQDLVPFLSCRLFELRHRWAVCAFGQFEHNCLTAAMLMGADVRVGFENNHYDNQGAIATNNASLVNQLCKTSAALNIDLLSATEFRNSLAIRQ